jgi:hypothetical protein
MNKIQRIVAGLGFLGFMTLAGGCQLETIVPPEPPVNSAGHMVINEVFTLPPTHPTPYSWIEMYNPTPDTVDLLGWTIGIYTARLISDITFQTDSLGNFIGEFSIVTRLDSVGRFDVPFAEGVLDIPGQEEDTLRLPPGGLFTLVNDEDRLLDHIEWGPGDERFRLERQIIQGPLVSFTVVDSTDTLITFLAQTISYGFYLQETEQIELKDPAGNVIDVVRYGDYQYTGPSTNDPYPGNVSLGIMPQFQSFQRYANAYHTGNSANDFYVSSSQIVPTPQWYSQVHKR